MAIQFRWVGDSEADRNLVAQTRLRCYARTPGQIDEYRNHFAADSRATAGDFLLAEKGGDAVGTTTSLSLTSWVRGAAIPTQGIAWVGTIRTYRRSGNDGKAGIASQLMLESLRQGRQRQQVLSYLMPFRGSFYEHFGYGLIERRAQWTIPLAIIPKGSGAGYRFLEPTDRPALEAGWRQYVTIGQCQVERSAAWWQDIAREHSPNAFEVIDCPDPSQPAAGYLAYDQFAIDGRDYLHVHYHFARDLAAFQRQLRFLSSLKDQYFGVRITLPADFPLNWYLTERQLPHRLVNHPVAECKPITRLQARVLDHRRLIEAMHLPADRQGRVVVAVHESEKTVSKFQITLEAGRAVVLPTDAIPTAECSDVTWAAVVLGGMSASTAVAHGLLVADCKSCGVLDAFSVGPAPFCQEYF